MVLGEAVIRSGGPSAVEACEQFRIDGAGKIQILSKDEMARKPYELPSPNLADAVMMSMMLPESKAAPKKIKFKGWNG